MERCELALYKTRLIDYLTRYKKTTLTEWSFALSKLYNLSSKLAYFSVALTTAVKEAGSLTANSLRTLRSRVMLASFKAWINLL